MRIEGKRIKRTRLVREGRYVVAVDVELVIPYADPSEPCYEAETVDMLRQVSERAKAGDLGWLRSHGQVYELVESGQ